MKIYFTIPSLTFPYIIKILFFYKIQVPYLPSLFSQNPIQSSIKDKKMKDERTKSNVYIKIMYRKSLLVFYTLRNTITEGWLNIENLM
jgi:hypothetical protein